MQETPYNDMHKPVNYTIHINGNRLNVRATHREMLTLVRVLLRGRNA